MFGQVINKRYLVEDKLLNLLAKKFSKGSYTIEVC